jgi:prolyl-tRNA editing enzyme YbaK/EbsC (Cys-tRNA(Pro) deacylase)
VRGTIEVHRYLTERGIRHEFYRLERPLRRVDDAPAVLGLDSGIVVRAQLFTAGPQHVLALTPASTKASADAIARAISKPRARALTKARTAAYTGFLADWLPPVGHERPSKAILDEALVDAEVLYAPGGDPGVMLVLPSRGLFRATAATIKQLSAASELEEHLPSAATPTLS